MLTREIEGEREIEKKQMKVICTIDLTTGMRLDKLVRIDTSTHLNIIMPLALHAMTR